MGISKDYSVVADSEMASSPHASASSPAPIKRAARTYGRRREDPDSSFNYSEQESNNSIYRTGPPDTSYEVPPSDGPSGLVDSEEDGEEDDGDADILPRSLVQPRAGFGWRQKILEIDNKDDLSEYFAAEGVTGRVSSKDGDLTPAVIGAVDAPRSTNTSRPAANTLSKDCSTSSLLSITSPSPSPPTKTQSPRVPSPKFLRNRLRIQKKIISSDDDIEDSVGRNSRPSSPQSPQPPLVATPKSHQTSSPPTSNHDDASGNSTSSSASKGKGEHLSTRQAVRPLSTHMGMRLETITNPRPSLGPKQKKEKIKPPTKKEREETARERARLGAGREIFIEKPATGDRSIHTFLQSVINRQGGSNVDVAQDVRQEPSSPINEFSSSQLHPRDAHGATRPPTTRESAVSSSRQSPTPQQPTTMKPLLTGEDSDSDGLPDASSAFGVSQGRKKPPTAGTNKAETLQNFKLRLAETQLSTAGDTSDDSDLEVMPPSTLDMQRRSAKQNRLTSGQRMAISNGQVQKKHPSIDPRNATKEELDSLIQKPGTLDSAKLSALLRQRAEMESMDIVRQKEEEWKRLGGIVKEKAPSGSGDLGQRGLLQKVQIGVEAWENSGRKKRVEADDDDEEEDPDWQPSARGSRSPTPDAQEEEEIDYERMELGEDEDDDVAEENEDKMEAVESGTHGLDDEADQQPIVKSRSKNRPRANLVDSDESDSGDLNDENLSHPKPGDNRYVVSSSDDRTEDENDKENDTRRMFDRSEDKENKAVARHKLLSRSIFDGIDDDPSRSPPHVSLGEFDQENLTASQSTATPNDRRKPFGVISDSSPLSLQRQPSTLTQAFAAQLKHSSPARAPPEDDGEGDVFGSTPLAPAASLDFAPVFNDGDKKGAPLGFSQFSQDGTGSMASSMSFGAPALLKPGLSDLFDSGTQKDEAGGSGQGLRRQGTLGLTQDLVLQPAFQVDEKLLRKADAIFEKEQEYVVEAAGKKGPKEPEYYVNEVGLLTQTKPASRLGTRSPSFMLSPTQLRPHRSETPSGFGFTQTQTQRRSSDPTQPREPLRTISHSILSLSSPESSPKRRRLRKRGETPSVRGSPQRSPVTSGPTPVTSSPPPNRQSANAFDLLKQGARDVKAKGKDQLGGKTRETEHEKMIRREWMQEEAEESDEDQMVGFGLRKKRDGEDDEAEGAPGEDLDANLEELVDDQKMDEKTEAVDRVMEKHQELMEKDDDEALKFHQGVAQGEWRKKRKNRFGLDDSDEEDEEDDKNRRIRRKMRGQAAERGDIRDLAANEQTAAFANVYQTGLVDDEFIETRPLDFDATFKTDREPGDEDVDMEDSQETLLGDQEDRAEGEEEDKDVDRYFTYKEMQAEARKLNEQPQAKPLKPVEEWMAEQERDEDDSISFQVVDHRRKPANPTTSVPTTSKPFAELGSLMFGGVQRRKESEKDAARARAWAKSEMRNTTGSTGRKVGGIAVTGHGNRAKSGGGSLRSKGSSASAVSLASSSSLDGKKSLKAEGSVLAGIGKRKFQ